MGIVNALKNLAKRAESLFDGTKESQDLDLLDNLDRSW